MYHMGILKNTCNDIYKILIKSAKHVWNILLASTSLLTFHSSN